MMTDGELWCPLLPRMELNRKINEIKKRMKNCNIKMSIVCSVLFSHFLGEGLNQHKVFFSYIKYKIINNRKSQKFVLIVLLNSC